MREHDAHRKRSSTSESGHGPTQYENADAVDDADSGVAGVDGVSENEFDGVNSGDDDG